MDQLLSFVHLAVIVIGTASVVAGALRSVIPALREHAADTPAKWDDSFVAVYVSVVESVCKLLDGAKFIADVAAFNPKEKNNG